MKKSKIALLVCLLALGVSSPSQAQKYEMTFMLPTFKDSVLYIGQHFRDGLITLDSVRADEKGNFVFKGKKQWDRGIYALYFSHDKRARLDFTIDGSQRFVMKPDIKFHILDPGRNIIGSPANIAMFTYINRIDDAKERVKDIEERKASGDPVAKAEAEKDMEQLAKEMDEFEASFIKSNLQYRFFEITDMFNGPDVPDNVDDKSLYYRTHYWDDVDFSDHSLIYTPDLFNKMNYYFYGILYHADFDTICRYADMVLQKVENDSAMLRYFLDFIMPKYYRSTKQIGWDATWCYLVRKYYLAGKCPWATEADIINKRQTAEFLEKSLIGARGAELWMADTNQSPDTKDWISSHRFPQKYVILWFWDPDCQHCKKQTAELKDLYDSLTVAGTRPFEVYAVGYESDVEKWKKYVREHELPFVNVGGPNVNIDYQEAYNVHGAPTMIILNEERRIIMNKVLTTAGIMDFLDRYEKSHAAKHQPQNY